MKLREAKATNQVIIDALLRVNTDGNVPLVRLHDKKKSRWQIWHTRTDQQ